MGHTSVWISPAFKRLLITRLLQGRVNCPFFLVLVVSRPVGRKWNGGVFCIKSGKWREFFVKRGPFLNAGCIMYTTLLEYLLKKLVTNKRTCNRVKSSEYSNGTEGKINNRTCIWKNTSWQSRKHTKKTRIYLNRKRLRLIKEFCLCCGWPW